MPDLNIPQGSTERVSGTVHIGNAKNNTVTINGNLHVDGGATLVFDGYGAHETTMGRGISVGPNGTVTFENEGDVLRIDCTATACGIQTKFEPGATYGSMRGHIVYDGTFDVHGDGTYSWAIEAPRSGSGDVTITQVHWPNGSENPNRTNHGTQLGFWLHATNWPSGTGRMTFQNCWIRGWSHNLMYTTGWRGSIHVENCLFEANGSRGVSSGDNGTTVRDTTIVIGSKRAAQSHVDGPGLGAQGFTIQGDGAFQDVTMDNVHFHYDTTQERYSTSSHVVAGTSRNNSSSYSIATNNVHYESGMNAGLLSGKAGTNPQKLGNPMEVGLGGGSGGGGLFDTHTVIADAPEGTGQFALVYRGDITPLENHPCPALADYTITTIDSATGTKRITGRINNVGNCDAFRLVGHVVNGDSAAGMGWRTSTNQDKGSLSIDDLIGRTYPDPVHREVQCETGLWDITWNGRPRCHYAYDGIYPDFYESWVAGDVSTTDFQERTMAGEGTQALSVRDDATPPPNEAPIPSIDIASRDNLTVTLDGSGSSDPDGSIESYEWSIEDAADVHTAFGEAVTHTFASGGTYSVSLTLKDDRGAVSSAETTVSVTEPEQPPPEDDTPDALSGGILLGILLLPAAAEAVKDMTDFEK